MSLTAIFSALEKIKFRDIFRLYIIFIFSYFLVSILNANTLSVNAGFVFRLDCSYNWIYWNLSKTAPRAVSKMDLRMLEPLLLIFWWRKARKILDGNRGKIGDNLWKNGFWVPPYHRYAFDFWSLKATSLEFHNNFILSHTFTRKN